MTAKRKTPVRGADGTGRPGRPDGVTRTATRRPADTPSTRRVRRQRATTAAPGRESRPRPAPPKNTTQAKARAKARKAKAPKVVRIPLRERLITRLASVDLRPRTLAAKVPFVVLIIGSLGFGLGITLWLSTDAAERSYELGNVREHNRLLLQQKEALERDVLAAQSAPALAEAARNLGMIPTRDTAHLVQDAAGNWVVIGNPKPADGAPPPPLNTKLPEDQPAAPAPTAAPVEVPVRMPPAGAGSTVAEPLRGLQEPLSIPVPGAPIPGVPQLPDAVPPVVAMPDAVPTVVAMPDAGPAVAAMPDAPVTALPPGSGTVLPPPAPPVPAATPGAVG